MATDFVDLAAQNFIGAYCHIFGDPAHEDQIRVERPEAEIFHSVS